MNFINNIKIIRKLVLFMVNNYKEIPLGKAVDLSQQKFGRLTPLYRTENVSNKTAWVC